MSDVTVSVVESITSVVVSNDVVEINVTESPVTVSTAVSGPQGASYDFGDPIYVTVRNATGATLPKGTIVYISGSNGNHVQVTPAIATSDATSARTLGWLAASIANNADGLCQVEGYLEGLNTHGFTSGDQLYLSGTTAGAFTATKPQAPIHLVYVGVVTKVSAGDGHVFVKVQNGYELEELHDVQIISPVNNQVLTYDSATDLWKNATNPADGVTSITATAPLTGGTITSTGSIGIDQTALTVAQSQVTSLVSDLSGKASLGAANAFTVGGHTITNAATAVIPLVVTGALGQSANLQEWQTSTAGTAAFLSSAGLFTPAAIRQTTSGNLNSFGGAAVASQIVTIFTGGTANKGLIVQGAASQSANLQEWQNSGGTVLSRVTSTGSFYVNTNNNTTGIEFLGTAGTQFISANGNDLGIRPRFDVLFSPADSSGRLRPSNDNTSDLGTSGQRWKNIYSSGLITTNSTAGNVVAIFKGAASQTANLQEWQSSTGSILTRIASGGGIFTGQNSGFGGRVTVGSETVQGAARLVALATSASDVPFVARGAASQSVNLQEWQDSTGGTAARVTSTGSIVTSQGFAVLGGASISGTIATLLQSASAARIPVVVQGAASQSANLQEWQNSGGTALAKVLSGGNITATDFRTTNTYGLLGESNSGGRLYMVKQTAANSNPGAGIGVVYFRDGTNAGTLKLVVRAGAAGAETTILDNIPQT